MSKSVRGYQGRHFIVLLILLLVSVSCTPVTAQPATTAPLTAVRVTAVPYLSFAPLYIAQAEGYFAEQGLAVEFVRFQRNSDSLPALLQGQVDVDAIFTIGLLNAIQQGQPARVVANKGVLTQNGCPADAFVKRAGLAGTPSDFSADTLRKLKFGVDPTWIDSYFLQQWLAQYGVDLSEVATVYLPDPAARVEALRQGALDIAFLSEPWITRAQQSGAATVLMPAADIMPGYPLGILSFGPNLLNAKDDRGQRFLRAYLQGIRQYNEGKTARNVEIVTEFSKLDPDLVQAVCWPVFAADGQLDATAIAGYSAWAVHQGLADQALTPAEFWEPRYLNELGK